MPIVVNVGGRSVSAFVLPWDPLWHRIFHLVIFHTHNLPCYEYERGTSLAIPRVSHNMPKTFINSDLKHFWECQGWGGGGGGFLKNGAKGRLGEIFCNNTLVLTMSRIMSKF